MNTAICEKVMMRCAFELMHPKQAPNYHRLGNIISRTVERNPELTVDEIAQRVIAIYTGRGGITNLE